MKCTVKTKTVKAVIENGKIDYFCKGKKVNFEELSNIQKACIQVKIESEK